MDFTLHELRLLLRESLLVEGIPSGQENTVEVVDQHCLLLVGFSFQGIYFLFLCH